MSQEPTRDQRSHEERVAEVLQRARSPQAAHVFTRMYDEAAQIGRAHV